MPTNDPRITKAERRDEARIKALQLREEQKKREKRNRIVAITGLVAAVAVLAVVVVIILGQSNSSTSAGGSVLYTGSATIADVAKPSTAEANGAIPVGAGGVAGEKPASGDVIVSVYTDYMCPYCHEFETANNGDLAKLRAAGGVTVEYHPISILDRLSSGTDYSTRSANDAAVVADKAPDKFVAFSSALYDNQPAENSQGLSDAEIAKVAQGAGVPQSVIDAFTAAAPGQKYRTFSAYVAALTNQAGTDLGASFATPTVMINGTQFKGDLYTAGPLTQAILAAKG